MIPRRLRLEVIGNKRGSKTHYNSLLQRAPFLLILVGNMKAIRSVWL